MASAAAPGSLAGSPAAGTALGLGETTLCIERLLPGGEYKGVAAIGTIQRAILEL
jgi:hypothetical protein